MSKLLKWLSASIEPLLKDRFDLLVVVESVVVVAPGNVEISDECANAIVVKLAIKLLRIVLRVDLKMFQSYLTVSTSWSV